MLDKSHPLEKQGSPIIMLIYQLAKERAVQLKKVNVPLVFSLLIKWKPPDSLVLFLWRQSRGVNHSLPERGKHARGRQLLASQMDLISERWKKTLRPSCECLNNHLTFLFSLPVLTLLLTWKAIFLYS